jgi:hypothetical protein
LLPHKTAPSLLGLNRFPQTAQAFSSGVANDKGISPLRSDVDVLISVTPFRFPNIYIIKGAVTLLKVAAPFHILYNLPTQDFYCPYYLKPIHLRSILRIQNAAATGVTLCGGGVIIVIIR